MKSRMLVGLMAALFAFALACSDGGDDEPGNTGGSGASDGTGGSGGDGGDGGSGGDGGDGGSGGDGGDGGAGGSGGDGGTGGNNGEVAECNQTTDRNRLLATTVNAYELTGLMEYVDGRPQLLDLEEGEERHLTYFRLVPNEAGNNGALTFVDHDTPLPPEGDGADDGVPVALRLDMPNNLHNGAFGRGEDVVVTMEDGWIVVRGTWNTVGLYRSAMNYVPLDHEPSFGEVEFRYDGYCNVVDSGCDATPALFKLIAQVGRREVVMRNYGETGSWSGRSGEWILSNDGAAYLPGPINPQTQQFSCNDPLYITVITAVHLAEPL